MELDIRTHSLFGCIALLRQKSEQCRRLAYQVLDERSTRALRAMAEECDAEVEEIMSGCFRGAGFPAPLLSFIDDSEWRAELAQATRRTAELEVA